MEAIVNYSSEDEQDESNAHSGADRGGSPYRTKRPRSRAGSGSSASSHSPHRSAANGSIGKSYSNNNNNNNTNTGRNSNYHRSEESSQKYRTWSAPNRSANYSRDGGNGDRYRRDDDNRYNDVRERGGRDSREYKNNTTMQHERHRGTKDFRDDYKRDNGNYRDNRRAPQREDDRNYHHNRHSFGSSSNSGVQHKDRYSGNGRDERQRYSDSSSVRHHQYHHHQHQHQHQRGRDDREDRSNRYDRPDRSRMRYHHHHTNRESRSRTRSRSNSKERIYGGSSDHQSTTQKPKTKPLELARQSALEMERKLNVANAKHSDADKSPPHGSVEVPSRKLDSLLSLPLNENAPKQPNVIAIAPASVSATAAPTQTAEPSVIQLPSYYNPCVINPTKYAEQVQKRKLLWGAKKNEDTTAKWNNAQFSQDADGKVASKFMRLMGIKGSGGGGGGSVSSNNIEPSQEVEKKTPAVTAPDMRSREEMFSSMEQQYEVARQATHTMRGVGLGFSSQTRPF